MQGAAVGAGPGDAAGVQAETAAGASVDGASVENTCSKPIRVEGAIWPETADICLCIS